MLEDGPTRVVLAAGVALLVAAVLVLLPTRGTGARDLVLVGYAVLVAVLGVLALLGTQAAVIAAVVIGGAVALGGLIYVLLALAGRWARGE